MEANYKVAISIVTYNALDSVKALLSRLNWVEYSQSFKLYITDNNSKEEISDFIQKNYPWIDLTINKINVGFGNGHYTNYQKAAEWMQISKRETYFLVLNPDLLASEKEIKELVSISEKKKEVGIAAPALIGGDLELEESIIIRETLWSYALSQLGLYQKIKKFKDFYKNGGYVEGVSGACMLIRDRALKDTGFFNLDIFMYAEDQDLCYRMHEKSWKILYIPEIKLFHAKGKSSGNDRTANLWRKKQLYLSKLIYYRSNRPRYEYFIMKIGAIIEMKIRILMNNERAWAKEVLNLVSFSPR